MTAPSLHREGIEPSISRVYDLPALIGFASIAPTKTKLLWS